MRRARVVGVLVLLLMLVGVRAASAHAVLESTTPTQGSQVTSAPATVSIHFGEGVGINERSLEVLDPTGHRVDRGTPTHPGGDASTVEVQLRPGLPRASYAVLWHVVSADSHPVSGAFSFGVGVAAGATPAAAGGSPLVGSLAGGMRALAYAGSALLIGGLLFLLLLWPAGLALPRARLLLRAGWVASVIAAVGIFFLEGPYGAGLGLGSLTDTSLIRTTLDGDLGKLLLVRLALLALAVPLIARASDRRTRLPLGVLAVAGAATFSFGEHSGQGIQVPLAGPLDMVHVLAASCWLGGLVMLAALVLTRDHARELAALLPRWSHVAMVCVASLVASGLYLSWREVGFNVHALTGTAYGVTLIVKVALFAVMLGFAEFGRRWIGAHASVPAQALAAPAAVGVRAPALVGGGAAVQVDAVAVDSGAGAAIVGDAAGGDAAGGAPVRRRPPGVPGPHALRQLRTSVASELGIGVAVLVATALLVNGVPARDAYASPYSATVVGVDADDQHMSVVLEIDPADVGRVSVHLYTYTTAGRVLPYASVTASMVERDKGVGPVQIPFTDTGPGHGTADGVVIPVAGTWTLTAEVDTDPFTTYAATMTVPVR